MNMRSTIRLSALKRRKHEGGGGWYPQRMEIQQHCSVCHHPVESSDYFCRNCGKNLHPMPQRTDWISFFLFCIGSIVIAPLGIVWGIRYLRGTSARSKIFGLVLIILTLGTIAGVSIVLTTTMNRVNEEVSRTLNGMYGVY